MLNSFKVNDTIENLNFTDIKDNCIICDTHLVSIIEVSGANLYEKKEAEAISYMNGLATVINDLSVPIQLISQSRPKDYSNHIRKIRKELKKNDYYIKFKKDIEWFELYYDKDLKDGKITKRDIQEAFNKSDEYIERSMLESYIERLETMIKNNNILERKYYFVISTLEEPEGIEEHEIARSYNKKLNFSDENIFQIYKNKLEKITKHAINSLTENSGMAIERKNTQDLKNIMFDYFNFPISKKHKINEYLTEYGEIATILNNSFIDKSNEYIDKNYILSIGETILNNLSSTIASDNSKDLNEKSNNTNQLIKPFYINDKNLEYVQINNSYSFTIHINRFGQEYLEDLVLWPILTLPYFYDLSVHLIHINREDFLLKIKRKKQNINTNYSEKIKSKGSAEISYENDKASDKLSELNLLENNLRNKESGIFSTSIDITFRATSKEEIMMIKEKVKSKLSTKRIFYSEATGNHLDGFISTAPLLKNRIAGEKKIFERIEQKLEEVTHFYPYCPDAITSEKGLGIGITRQGSGDEESKNILFFDYFDRDKVLNSISLGIGQSGSGKTTFEFQLARGQELLGNKHLFIDFLGNYVQWAKDTPDKYKLIKIDPSSSDKINPCDIVFPDNEILTSSDNFKGLGLEEIKDRLIDEKISELSAYYKMFLEDEYNPKTRGILDKATKRTYQEKLKNIDITKIKFYGDILLSDIVETLLKEKDNDTKKFAKEIVNMLETYTSGSMSGMFNSKTNIEIDNRSVVFYLRGNKEAKYKELAILQSFLMVKRIAYSSKHNILVIDELAELMRIKSAEIQNFFRSQMATIRNLDGGIFAWTQFLDQILEEQAGREFFKLATTKIYLAGGLTQSDDKYNVINYETSFSNASKNYLLNNNRPGYGIMLMGGEQIQFKIDNHPDVCMFERYKPPKD